MLEGIGTTLTGFGNGADADSSWMELSQFDAIYAQCTDTAHARVCHDTFAALWCFCSSRERLYSFHTAPVPLGDTQVGQPGLAKLGLAKPGLSEPGLSKLGLAKPGLSEPGLSKLGLAKPGLSEPGLSKLGLAKPGLSEPGLSKPGLSKPGLSELLALSQSRAQSPSCTGHDTFTAAS
ncbi:hypothetical protein TURU_162921 [Turdus rufiventris]|nr:hypothetical protein TURU_162921 [Turdus rufiventris]